MCHFIYVLSMYYTIEFWLKNQIMNGLIFMVNNDKYQPARDPVSQPKPNGDGALQLIYTNRKTRKIH